MGDRERIRIKERMVANLITHVELGRVLAGAELHAAAAEEERISGFREILEEERRIELKGEEGGS